MKIDHCKYLLVIFLGFIFSTSYAQLTQSAVPNWVLAPQSKVVKPDLEDINDGYYLESSEYQVNLQHNIRFYRDVKVIFDNAGTENAGNINVYFNPEYQKVIFHELYVLRNGKKINKLNLAQIKLLSVEDDLTRSIYNGMKSAYFIIDDLRKDDKVIASYSIQGFNAVFQNKFSDYYNLQAYEPIGQVFVAYFVPTNRQLNFKEYNQAPKPKVEQRGDFKTYVWDIAGTKKTIYSYFTPSWYSNMPYIECSEYHSWKEVTDWIVNINPILPITQNSPLGKYVNETWHDSKGDPYVFLDKVTYFVQNEVRYMGVEVGEYSHRANNPERVFEQRYGDCKDKSVLLASILQSKGIGANLVLAHTSREFGLRDKLPSPLHFNHMIVEVNVDGRNQFLDPTITNQGGDIKNRFLPYYGDVLSSSSPKELIGLPKEANRKVKIEETYQLEKGHKATLQVHSVYEGGSADEMRNYFKTTAKNQIQKSYLDYYIKLFPKTEKKVNLRIEDDIVANKLEVFEQYSIDELGTVDKDLGKRILPLYGSHLVNYIPSVDGDHVGPVALDYPMNIEHFIRVINANGQDFNMDGGNLFQERTAYSYGKHITTNIDTLKINYQLSIHSSYVEEQDVAFFKEDFANTDELLYNGYYLTDNGSIELDSLGNSYSLLSYFIALFTLITTLIFIIKYYHKTTPKYFVSSEQPVSDQNLSGWTIFLGFSLFASCLRLLSTFLSDDSFLDNNVWLAHRYLGINPFLYNSFVVFEIIGNTIIIVSFVYCLVLYFQKRDLFPQTMLIVFIVNITFITLDSIIATLLLPAHFTFSSVAVDFVRNLIFTFVWGSYILKSENIKSVFVRTYETKIEIIPNDQDIAWKNMKEVE